MPLIKGTAYENVELEFNVVELKIYLSDDIVEKKGSNKIVGLHTDLQFLENGIQQDSDSARGDHLTVVLSIGSTRHLHLVPCCKQGNFGKWEQRKDDMQLIEMTNNSMFVLLPNNKKPKPNGGYFE